MRIPSDSPLENIQLTVVCAQYRECVDASADAASDADTAPLLDASLDGGDE